MRLPKSKSLAATLASVALFACQAAEAGLPTVCTTCAGQPETSRIRGPHKHAVKRTGHICADCAAKMQAQGMTPPTMMAAAPGGCTACGTAGPAPAAVGASAPGYAMVGDGSPSPLLLAGGSAPGYAIVGGTMVSSEPAPVGVMQTNYRAEGQPQGTLGASMPSNRGGMPGMASMPGIPNAQPSEVPPSLYAPQRRRTSVLARVIGLPSMNRRRIEAETRQRESHAMTSYGANNGPPTELPSSDVFRGSGH